MFVQNNYDLRMGKARKGLAYDITSGEHVGRSVEGNPVRFGSVVVQGALDNGCKVPDAPGGFVLGITELAHVGEALPATLLPPYGTDADEYYTPVQCEVSIRTQGRIYVQVENDVSPGDPVYYRHTAAGVQLLGDIRGGDDDGATCTLLPGARFFDTATAGSLAIVSLNNMPAGA